MVSIKESMETVIAAEQAAARARRAILDKFEEEA